MTMTNAPIPSPAPPPIEEEVPPGQSLFASLSAGLIVGLLQVFLALSFAALIFSGTLSFAIAQGIGLALVGTMLIGAIIALFTSLPGTVGGSQDVPAAIMAATVAAITAALAATTTRDNSS